MTRIVFEMLHVAVETRLIAKLVRFKDGCMAVNGVRVVVIGTKLYFKVLSWSDVESLSRLNVDLSEYLDLIRGACRCKEEQLLVRRVKYNSDKVRKTAYHGI